MWTAGSAGPPIFGRGSVFPGYFQLGRVDGPTYIEIATHRGISAKAVEEPVSRALRFCEEIGR